MRASEFKPGDWVIYRKQKVSSSPGRRAQNTVPSSKGETYRYVVEKHWVVRDVLDNGQLLLCTRRGKQHVIARDDPRLRTARWWECWLYGGRFRAVQESLQQRDQDAG